MVKRNREYIEFLKERFDEHKYIEFISDLLNLSASDINTSIIELKPEQKQYNDTVEYYKFIANYSSNSDRIGIFIVKLTDEGSQNARTSQRTFISTLLNKYNLDASIVAFYQENEPTWRLSFVKKELSFTDKGIKVDLTPAKRYSYLVGEGESVHTAQEYLFSLLNIEDRKITLSDIEKVFDVEKVTKKFFEEYKEKYLSLKEYLDKNIDFITESENCDFTSEEFAKKLMGQIVFLYFLQKKGWLGVQIVPNELTKEEYIGLINQTDSVSNNLLEKYYVYEDDIYKFDKQSIKSETINDNINNFVSIFKGTKYDMPWGTGDKQFVRNMFRKSRLDHKDNFFDEYLEPFFYTGLNEKRENQYFSLFNCKIPFLNGGLFEPLNNYRWSSAQFNIPDDMFSNDKKSGILDIFDLYNFTIDEEEPLEKDIAVDPEMLGKIFENLLDVKDRKSTGSFYTPREIVHYMCQESLANYIVNKLNIPYEDISNFIKYGDVITQTDWINIYNEQNSHLLPESIWNNILSIDKALVDVKIADPAVGSGAFPLGMLNEIVKLRDNISSYILIQEDKNIISRENIPSEQLNRDSYSMKLQTIQNSIYAVDLEMSAVDIAKLRLWLSLIVDYPNDHEPRPLPNLDCKIMQGNSLLDEYEGVPLFSKKALLNNLKKYHRNDSKLTQVNDIVIQQQLTFDDQDINIDDYLTKMLDYQKEYFITSDNKIKKDLKKQIDRIQFFMVEETLKFDKNKLAMFKEIAKKKSKPWFIWQLEFFDVFKNNDGFDIVIGNPPYVNNGEITSDEKKVFETKYIVPNSHYDLYIIFYNLGLNILKENGVLSFITSNKWLNQKYGLKLRKLVLSNKLISLLNFNDVKIFDTATVDTEITIIKKTQDELKLLNKTKDYDFKGCDFNNKMNINDLKYTIFNTKIIKCTDDLNFNLNISDEDISIINKIYNNSIPFENICYNTLGAVIHCKESMNDKKEFLYETKIPGLVNYIEGKDILKWKVKEPSKFLKYTPEKHREPRFPELFDGKKIFSIRMSSKKNPHRFALNTDDYSADSVIVSKKYCDIPLNKINIGNIEIKNQELSYEYLIGLLNSKLLKYVFFLLFSDGLHFYPSHLKQMPIKVGNVSEVENLVKHIINSDDNEKKYLENKLDLLVYNIYGLTEQEMEIVEKYNESIN